LACGSDRDSTANDAKPIKFFYTIRWWYITLQEIARFSIGVLVVEVSTESGGGGISLRDPAVAPHQHPILTKYRSHSGLCMTESFLPVC